MNDETREALAAYAHEAWSGWMRYLFKQGTTNADGSFTIRPGSVERWVRQMETAYADLSEEEKQSDRNEADAMLAIVNKASAAPDLPTACMGLLEHARDCNPQDPDLQALDECPSGHPNECGRCYAVRTARTAVAKARGDS